MAIFNYFVAVGGSAHVNPCPPLAQAGGRILFRGKRSCRFPLNPPSRRVFHSCVGSRPPLFAPILPINSPFLSTYSLYLSTYSRFFPCNCQFFFLPLLL